MTQDSDAVRPSAESAVERAATTAGARATDAAQGEAPGTEVAGQVRPDDTRLVWVDMEMSGLRPEIDRIIEIALVVTDARLEVIAQAEPIAIRQSEWVLGAMDDWNKATHGRSGLVDRVRASGWTEAAAEDALLRFLAPLVPAGASPMCGNSICQDRRFMARYMPRLEGWFHYRNVDVSTLKELCKRWKPEVARGFAKRSAHTARADILESIDELRYYRDRVIAPVT